MAGGVILLIAFGIYESRYEHAMMPMRIFANRARSGAYIVMAVVGAGLFGMFYFLTFFVQGVMGYSSLKAGFAFVPVSVVIIIGSGIMTQVMPRTGPKVLISIGADADDDRAVLLRHRQRRLGLPDQDPSRAC